MKAKAWIQGIVAHVRKWSFLYLVVLPFLIIYGTNHRIGIFKGGDGYGKVYILANGEMPTKNDDIVVYRLEGEALQNTFLQFDGLIIGHAAGLPGDGVSQTASGISVGDNNYQFIDYSNKGINLQPNTFEGQIPDGHYYISGFFEESIDSRYAMVGIVPKNRIVGRAYAIF